jgi:Helicase HerA, central domain
VVRLATTTSLPVIRFRHGKIPPLPQFTTTLIMRGNMDSGGVIHLGRVDFRNDDRVFGIKHEDRFSHLYIIGKTGTGKSTLLETMALQDLERGNGFALIDPHGDLVTRIAARIPASQKQRVFYLNATDLRSHTATIHSVTSPKIGSRWPLRA